MSNSETTITTSSQPERADPVVIAGGTSSFDPTAINHTERLTRLEETFGGMSSRMDGLETSHSELSNSVNSLGETFKSSLEGLNTTVSTLTSKLSEGVSTAVEAVAEPVEEIMEDMVPSIKEHAFFRRWGNKS